MLKITSKDLEHLAKNFSSVAEWYRPYLDQNMQGLGRRIAYLMRQQVRHHKYRGSFEESTISKYDSAHGRLEVGPTVKRGRYDGGLLLEQGTGPIPRLPWGPIAEWAAFRGLPAGPIWMSIRKKGIRAHPFLEATLARGDTRVAIQHTGKRIGIDLAARAIKLQPGPGTATVLQPELFS